MIRQRMTAIIAAAALLLSGCTSLSLNSSDIMTPPRAAGDRARLQSIIEEDSGGSYTLITPITGEYRTGIINHDFDGDGEEDAVALYTVADGTARALVAFSKGGSYSSKGSCTLSSSNVGSVNFADIDGDGVDELFVGCDTGSPAARLNACFTGDELTKIEFAEGLSGFVTGDFTGDSIDDVIVFIPANVKETARAVLITYSDGGFTEESSCETDPAVAAYARLNYGKISPDRYGVAADGVSETGDYSTQLIYFDPEADSLINPMYIYAGYDKTVRSSKILSCDADKDGIIEIPVCEPMKHSKDEDISQVCTLVEWCRYDSEQIAPVPVSESVMCVPMNFILNLSGDLTDKFTARCADRSSMTMYAVSESEKSVTGSEQFTVYYFDKGSYDSENSQGETLYESETGVYTCTVNEGSEFSFEDIKNSFALISEI